MDIKTLKIIPTTTTTIIVPNTIFNSQLALKKKTFKLDIKFTNLFLLQNKLHFANLL